MIRREAVVLWPSYFGKNLSRNQGRRVPLFLAVRNPSGESVVEAAGSLGMKAELEDGAHPSTWWRRTGKVLVTPKKTTKKNRLITEIARKLQEIEGKRSQERARKKKKRSKAR